MVGKLGSIDCLNVYIYKIMYIVLGLIEIFFEVYLCVCFQVKGICFVVRVGGILTEFFLAVMRELEVKVEEEFCRQKRGKDIVVKGILWIKLRKGGSEWWGVFWGRVDKLGFGEECCLILC